MDSPQVRPHPRAISWLHLSDRHTHGTRTSWDADKVIETLVADLKTLQRDHGLRPDLIFFTGDLAWGQISERPHDNLADQFAEGHRFLEAVRVAFSPEIPQENVFLVPGNHDIDRGKATEPLTDWLDGRTSDEQVTETHNNFVLDRGGKMFNRTAPVIRLSADATEDDHLALLGLLNSSTGGFYLKQVCFNKGAGGGTRVKKARKKQTYLLQAQRYGLHVLKLNVLRWLQTLNSPVAESQIAEIAKLDAQYGPQARSRQPFLPRRSIDGRSYEGRYFYTLIERLGTAGNRQLTLDQARSALDGGDLGTRYFAGVDAELMQIIASQDIDGLIRFGVRGKGSVDLSGKSAFCERPLELEDSERSAIRQTIQNAIDFWETKRIW